MILHGRYLHHHDLFGAEERSEVVVEVHLLLVALAVMADPQALWVGLQADV